MMRADEKHSLRMHLARGDKTQARLAELFGVTEQTISQFKKKNQERINAMREEIDRGLEHQFLGLWVVDQAKRIAHYESDIELIDSHLAESLDDDRAAQLLRIKQNAMKSVAEELGALPTRATVDHSGNVEVKYNIVSPGDGV